MKTDLVNLIRYKHYSGDYNSKFAWIARFVLTHSLPTNFRLKAMNLFRKVGGFKLMMIIASLLMGYLIGSRK